MLVLQGRLGTASGSTETRCLLAALFSRLQKDDVKIFGFTTDNITTPKT